jgi:hypothetical protein
LEKKEANRVLAILLNDRHDETFKVDGGHKSIDDIDIRLEQLIAQLSIWDGQRPFSCEIFHVVSLDITR